MGSGRVSGMEISAYHLALLLKLAQTDQTDPAQVVSDLVQRASCIPAQLGTPKRQSWTDLTLWLIHQGPVKLGGKPGMFSVFSSEKKRKK